MSHNQKVNIDHPNIGNENSNEKASKKWMDVNSQYLPIHILPLIENDSLKKSKIHIVSIKILQSSKYESRHHKYYRRNSHESW